MFTQPYPKLRYLDHGVRTLVVFWGQVITSLGRIRLTLLMSTQSCAGPLTQSRGAEPDPDFFAYWRLGVAFCNWLCWLIARPAAAREGHVAGRNAPSLVLGGLSGRADQSLGTGGYQ